MTLTVTDSVGDATSSTVSVNINPNPSVTITSNQNPADAGDTVLFSYPQASIVYSANQTDANASVEFRASGKGGVGPYNYEWVIAGF